jgi:poly-gamma-glutamate synthesis protein (capsule biosynthesis protein)
MRSKINIVFSGDFAPLTNGEHDYIPDISFLKDLSFDLHITNLESPLTKSGDRINKTGPHIKSFPSKIELLKRAMINIACLANNHIFDYGEEGLNETINVCESNGIDTLGIVKRADNKSACIIKEFNNKKIGFLNYCEHEFSVRGEDETGANGYDNIKAFYEVKELRKKCDYVIVIYHGGVEYYPLPRPGIKKTFRYLIDVGADTVISHHSHTISGFEIYKNKPIIYGLGNFFFPYENEPPEWYTGLICEMNFNDEVSFVLHPVRQSDDFRTISLLKGKEKEMVMKKIQMLNGIILNDEKLESEWIKYINSVRDEYIKSVSGFCMFKKIIYKSGLFKNKILNQKYRIRLSNFIKCDSHRDVLIKSLNYYE